VTKSHVKIQFTVYRVNQGGRLTDMLWQQKWSAKSLSGFLYLGVHLACRSLQLGETNMETVAAINSMPEDLFSDIKAGGRFALLLQVDLAYHSPLMGIICD
jgi:hypothetical protein